MLEHKHTYDILADGRKVIASTTTVCQIFETPEACMASQQLDDEDEDGRERFDDGGEGEGPERACLIEMVSYYTTVEGQPEATVAACNPPGFEETMVLSFWMGPPGAPATRPI